MSNLSHHTGGSGALHRKDQTSSGLKLNASGPPTRLYSLRFVVGPAEGKTIYLLANESVTIGRSLDADVVLLEDLVSRTQARLISGADLRMEDLNSTNGTLVNGKRVTHAILKDGDSLMFGSSAAIVES